MIKSSGILFTGSTVIFSAWGFIVVGDFFKLQEQKFITVISPAAIIAELKIILFIFHTENTGIYQHALTFLVYHTFLLNQDFDSAFEQKIAQNEFLLFIQIFL